MELNLLTSLLAQKTNEGYSLEIIESAEERLNLQFPPALKVLYLKFGKNAIVNGHHYLIPPQHLAYYKQNEITFYSENQSCGAWTIRWASDFSSIEIYNIDDFSVFALEETDLDVFLVKMCIQYFPSYLYAYQYTSFEFDESDERIIQGYFGQPKSVNWYGDNSIQYFWDSIDNMVILSDFDKRIRVYIYTKDKIVNEGLRYKLKARDWKKGYDSTRSKQYLERILCYDDELEEFRQRQSQKSKPITKNDLPF